MTGLAPGTVVGGRYRVVSKLGEGGMGAVYRATQEPLGREVALKVIAAALAVDPGAVERFEREAKASSSLSHPNIVTVYDYGNEKGELFLAMELIQGTAGDTLVAKGPLAWPRVVTILRGVCAALAEAHGKGIVHRDLKPANILVTSTMMQQDIAKVVDFGIAKMKDGGATLTMTGTVVGTPGYVAPELFDGKDPSALTDLYALGVVAFEFLCGRAPFPGKTPMELIKAHILTTPPAPSLYVSDVPKAFDDLVLSLLAKEPSQRPQSAQQLDAALAAIATTTSTPSRSAPASSASASSTPPAPAPETSPTGLIRGLTPAQSTEAALSTPLPPSPSPRAGLSPVVVLASALVTVLVIVVVAVASGAVSGGAVSGGRVVASVKVDDAKAEAELEALRRRVVDVAADGGVIGVSIDGKGDVRVTDPGGTSIYDSLTFKDAGVSDEAARKRKEGLEKIARLLGEADANAVGDGGGGGGGGVVGGSGGGGGGGGGDASKPKAALSAGTPVVLGSLDAAVIERVVRQHAGQVKYCYEKQLQRDPKLSGKIVIKAVINGEGAVTLSQVSESSLHNADVEQCVVRQAKTWVFPKPKGGGIVIIQYPFIFRAGV